MFTGSSRLRTVGDEIIAALFDGPKLRGSDDLSAFARRPNPPKSDPSPDGRADVLR
jgi:hypothetical protein